MSRDQAAKYLVVAWVKGWTLRMYLNTVGGGFKSIEWEDAHSEYPWLPSDAGMFMRDMTVRRYIADAFRVLNDKLWDAKDNTARLSLAKTIEKLSGAGSKVYISDASKELRKVNKSYKNAITVSKLSVDAMRRGSGHAWGVVK